MLKDFNLLEIFWDYDIIVTIDMPSLGYYPALGLYSAGQSTLTNNVHKLTGFSSIFFQEAAESSPLEIV